MSRLFPSMGHGRRYCRDCGVCWRGTRGPTEAACEHCAKGCATCCACDRAVQGRREAWAAIDAANAPRVMRAGDEGAVAP